MTAPWWLRALTGLGVAVIGLLTLWINSQDPIFGVKMNDPAAYVFMALFAVGGLAVAVWPRGWERGPAPADVPETARRGDDRGD